MFQNAPESFSERLKLKKFPGGACPQTPLAAARAVRVHHARGARIMYSLVPPPF